MRYVLLKVDFYSPYTSVQVFAEHGRGPPVPPPSTLIGALAAPLYHPEEKWELGADLLDLVKYVTFWVPPYAVVENISRHFSIFSQRKQRAKVIGAAMRLVEGGRVADVYDDLKNYANVRQSVEELERFGRYDVARMAVQVLLQPATRLETYFAESGYVLYVVEDKLAEVAKRVFRIGPKESLVAATPIEVRVEPLESEVVKTRFYAPEEAGSQWSKCVNVYMLERPSKNPLADLKRYCVPEPLNDMEVEVGKGWRAVRIVGEGVELKAVLPSYAAP